MAKSLKQILKNTEPDKVNESLRAEVNEHYFFSPGCAALLERTDQTALTFQPAKQMYTSNKNAWEMIAIQNTQGKRLVVILQFGGESGGGSKISNEAGELITLYRLLRKRYSAFFEKQTRKLLYAYRCVRIYIFF